MSWQQKNSYLCNLDILECLAAISFLSLPLSPRQSATASCQSSITSAILLRCWGITWPLMSLYSKSISWSSFHRTAAGTETKMFFKVWAMVIDCEKLNVPFEWLVTETHNIKAENSFDTRQQRYVTLGSCTIIFLGSLLHLVGGINLVPWGSMRGQGPPFLRPLQWSKSKLIR